MRTNQICVECGSDDLRSLAPAFPHIDECGNCGHPNDAAVKKVKAVEEKEKEPKCKMCKRANATTTAVKPFSGEVIDVCNRCFNDIIDEEDE